MFGYIRPLKPELKIKDYELYRSVYCGLCKELGRTYGPFARLTLNYDFTFLAMLELSLQQSPPCTKRQHCMIHPFTKRLCCQSCSGLKLTAAAALIMVYYKNLDNLHDSGISGKIAALALYPFAALSKRKAAKLYPQLDIIIGEAIERQTQLEREQCTSIDKAADPTATVLAKICELFSDNPKEQRVLSRFGYLTGRWVYLIDALDDLEQDATNNGYNVFLLSGACNCAKPQDYLDIKKSAAETINLTHGEMTKAFQLLNLKQYASILENILFLGLPNTQALVISPRRSNKHDRSL